MRPIQRILLAAALIATAACTVANPRKRLDAGPDSDAGPDPIACTKTCTGDTAVCDTSIGQCVQCTAAEHSACSGTTPACGTDGTCQACTQHSQCDSKVCLLDGTCSDGHDVAYVDPRGSGDLCTQAAPCASFSKALSTDRLYIKTTSTIKENVTINRSSRVILFADPRAQLTADSGSAVSVLGGSNVTIYDLEITGGKQTVGLSLLGQTAKVLLERAKFTNLGGGVSVSATGSLTANNVQFAGNSYGVRSSHGGPITITNSTISGGDVGIDALASNGEIVVEKSVVSDNRYGVELTGGTVWVRQSTIKGNATGVVTHAKSRLFIFRSTIMNNTQGGVDMQSPTEFSVADNFIIRNGGPTSPVGGIKAWVAAGVPSYVEYNTIADNVAGPQALSGGASCKEEVPPNYPTSFWGHAWYNLYFRNRRDPGTSTAQLVGDCWVGASFNVDGTKTDSPGFVNSDNPPNYDYHLTASSPEPAIRNISDAFCPGRPDFDGQTRPLTGICDAGADEL